MHFGHMVLDCSYVLVHFQLDTLSILDIRILRIEKICTCIHMNYLEWEALIRK